MPWSSSGYLVVLSGATIETEAAYALGVNRYPPYSDFDFGGFVDLGRYEPNGTEQTAAEVTDDSMMAYLHKNDIDYYRYMVPCPESEPEFEGGSFLSLDSNLTWLGTNAAEGGTYLVTVSGNETVAPRILSYSGKTVSITLLGGAAERTVSLSSNGALFTVESGVTLTLGNNITLKGRSSNTSALIQVDSDGALVMQSGSKISGNTNTSSDGYGGGVQVNGGAFTMGGGEISGNSAFIAGGGVYVSSGTFTKHSGGIIYGADASGTLKNTAANGFGYGHAVSVSGDRRDLTVSTGESLDSTKGGTAGGWTESKLNLPLTESLAWLSANAVEGGTYTVTVSGDEIVAPSTLSYSGKTVSITLLGDSAERTVSLSSSGALFTVGNGVTLKLGNNITLQGRTGNNTSALVRVDSGGALVMQSGSKISGNRNSNGYGGGVYVSGGEFTMNGGVVSGNTATASYSSSSSSGYGGGVYASSGTFTMSGGVISGNTASGIGSFDSSNYYCGYGGGVYVSGSSFAMSGGEISGNIASGSQDSFGYGGGVYVSSGTFTKQSGGIIYGTDASDALKNTAKGGDGCGHAVYVNGSPANICIRNATADSGVILNSATNGSAGGWEAVVPTPSLSTALEWLNSRAAEGGVYTITLNGNETATPKTLSCGGKTVSITLLGGAAERTVSLSSSGALFTVGSGVTLTLGNNITLLGRTSNSSALIQVNSGGALEMKSGSKIRGNTNSAGGGGGVYVSSGTFTMSGGEISNNSGSGVYVSSPSGFTMSGGTISGNTSSTYGGGVMVASSGRFTMSGGEISRNSAALGGGVWAAYITPFTKQSGGIIYGSDANSSLKNTASSDSYGHAVYVDSSPAKKRNSTAGEGVTLDGTKTGSEGGWE
jgi:D-alanine-D-alanine ligase-like ATP-grasp enzyme